MPNGFDQLVVASVRQMRMDRCLDESQEVSDEVDSQPRESKMMVGAQMAQEL
jgi:hypothetical protein